MTANSKDSLGDRMKGYENAFRYTLPNRMPLILRIDGKSFHTYTQHLDKPFDAKLISALDRVVLELCQEIDGAVFAYTQSDEISVLIHNYRKLDTQPWFKNNLQKICSVSAAVASSAMTLVSKDLFGEHRRSHFDSRVFVLPESEVCNYFLWRQQDASRNSVQMLARSLYSHKDCNNKNNSELQEMTFAKGQNWNDLPTHYKRGRCAYRRSFEANGAIRSAWVIDNEIPIFSQNREYIEQWLKVEEE